MGPIRWRLVAWLIPALILFGLIAFSWQRSLHKGVTIAVTTPPMAMPDPPPNHYVGSQVCRECHAAICDSYGQHPMAASTSQAYSENSLENYQEGASFSPNPGNRYYVEKKDGRIFHHEVGLDSQGEVLYDQGVQIHYAIGSGKRGRSYLTDRNGVLFQSPISWYSQQKRWDLSPNYPPGKHARFDRRASDRCLQCHVGRLANHPREPGNDLAVYPSPPFPEPGIGCERCHGPAEKHVEWHRSLGSRSGSDPIVNPAKLDPLRRDSVCNQCHLQGELQVLRYGRTHGDFRPGDELGKIWSVFVDGTGIDEAGSTIAVSHVQQMRTSRCFTQSDGRLGCTSCHDPHRAPSDAEKTGHFDRRCQTCHATDDCSAPGNIREQPPARGSCIACHMPRLSAQDVPHTTQTDHRIPRIASSTAEVQRSDSSLGKLTVFDSAKTVLPEYEGVLIWGLMYVEEAKATLDQRTVEQGAQQLMSIRSLFNKDARLWDGLGISASMLGRQEQAADYWVQALALQPRNESVLYSLVLNAVSRNEVGKGLEWTAKYLAVNPWTADVHFHRSKFLFRAGQLVEATAAAEKAVELNPSVPEFYEWLARVHRSGGNLEKAAEIQRLLDRFGTNKLESQVSE